LRSTVEGLWVLIVALTHDPLRQLLAAVDVSGGLR
jgi:hypothetical protein